MLFTYQARTTDGASRVGSIEAAGREAAIQALQRQNLVVVSIDESIEKAKWYEKTFQPFRSVKQKDVMILTRQLSTLFEAKVPIVQTFKTLIGEEQAGPLRVPLIEVLDDVQGGLSMSKAMEKQPKVFSDFYVNMVRSGEESGKLDEVFKYLADYLERNYKLLSKVRNALVYPAFVLVAFLAIMLLMFTFVVPRLAVILEGTGQDLPVYTKMVLGFSNFLVSYGIILLVLLAGVVFFAVRYLRTDAGKRALARTQISAPVVGGLFKELYLARVSDNLQTLVSSGLPIIKSLQITADVVGNKVYQAIILEAIEAVRGGATIADSFIKHPEMPHLFSQMVRIGEETGKLDGILKALARFYAQEVDNFVDNIVSLIEPILIVALGVGVGVIVASILIPIYNITATF